MDSSSRKTGSQAHSLKLHVQSSRNTSKMATSHPAGGIDGNAFVGSSVGTFLLDDGASIWLRDRSSTVGFERLFLWPITKTNSKSVEVSNTTITHKLLAFVGYLLCRMGTQGCYKPENQFYKYGWNLLKLTLVVVR